MKIFLDTSYPLIWPGWRTFLLLAIFNAHVSITTDRELVFIINLIIVAILLTFTWLELKYEQAHLSGKKEICLLDTKNKRNKK